jgi:hypothetical protein
MEAFSFCRICVIRVAQRRLAFRFESASGFWKLPFGEPMTPLSAAGFSHLETGWFAAVEISVR